MEVAVVTRRDVRADDIVDRAQAKVGRLARRSPLIERAEVRLTGDAATAAGCSHRCHVTLSGHGHVLRASADAAQPAAALDLVVAKLEHQVERLKAKTVRRPKLSRRRPAI